MFHFILKTDAGTDGIFDEKQAHQVINVLRMQAGDYFVGIKKEKALLCEISGISQKSAKYKVLEDITHKYSRRESKEKKLKVYMPLLKGEKIELCLQKCVELGADEFEFIDFERTARRFSKEEFSKKLHRWNKVIEEAVEQSERLKIPEIKENLIRLTDLSTEKLLEESLKKSVRIAFLERLQGQENINLQELINLLNNSEIKEVSVLFGPEGGISQDERLKLKELNFLEFSLGERILRSETAIIFGSGLICQLYN